MPRYTIFIPTLLLATGCASRTAHLAEAPPTGCAAGQCPLAAETAATTPASLSDATLDALCAALADERRARAFYLAVLNRHGRVMPFANIAQAEARHAQLVADLLTAYGYEMPPDTAAFPPENVPDTVALCCAAAAQSEIDNIALYDDLILTTDDEASRRLFTQLQWASRERHLPAFRRRATGG